MADFKVALTAGHYKYTSGKRCLKSLDPKETREWTLNARIAEKVEKLLGGYSGVSILRTDDRTGEKDVSLSARTTAANNFGADFYLSMHHNAGIKGGKGGGIVAYVYTSPSAESVAWQKDLYNALIAKTGLKGNRSNPLAKSNLHEVRETKMPAVLLELGFMDSATDVPVILTEDYANKCAEAIVSVIVSRGKLTKKETDTGAMYRVQVGAYSKKESAEEMADKLKTDGYHTVIDESTTNSKEATNSATVAEKPAESKEKPLSVGDKVKLTADATVYGKNTRFSSWVYNSTLYVRSISGSKVVVSTAKTGAVTGTVDKKYLVVIE